MAEASLQDAEKRLILVRKWQPALQQAAIEYHASVQRLKYMASSEVPRAVALLAKIVEALEAYLQVHPPAGAGGSGAVIARATPEMEALVRREIDGDEAVDAAAEESPRVEEAG